MSQYDGYEAQVEPAPSEEPDGRPPGRGATILVAALVTVLVIVLCGGGVTALYLIGARDQPPARTNALSPTHPASPSPSGTPSLDPNTILKGQCLVNQGTADAPVLRVVSCRPGTYQVLQRFDGTSDKARCSAVPGSNFNYFYDTTPDTLDFVLCLKKL
jgi:hypothetical protein